MKRVFLLALALALLAACAAADGALGTQGGQQLEELAASVGTDGSGECSDDERFFDGGYEDEDPVEDALKDYDSVVRAYARTVLGISWQQEEPMETLILNGFVLEDVTGDGTLELILYRTGEKMDEICGLYGLDAEGGIVDMLPGFGSMYRYTLCTADDGSFVLRRKSDAGDAAPLYTCAFYRFDGLEAAWIDGYVCQDGICYRAQDDAPRVPGGAQTMTMDEAFELEEDYPPYLEEYWFTASVSDYLWVEGDVDAVSAWEE